MIYKILKYIALLPVSFLTSCMVDYSYGTSLHYVNNSSHDIVIEWAEVDGYWRHLNGTKDEIPRGATVVCQAGGMDIFPDISAMFDVKIIYDGKIVAEDGYSNGYKIPHSITKEQHYDIVRINKYTMELTYTFTDADYDYAVAYQEEMKNYDLTE